MCSEKRNLVKGLENKTYEDWLRDLRKRRLRIDHFILYNYLEDGCSQVGLGLFLSIAIK